MDPTLPISIHTLDALVNNAAVEAHGSIEELPTEAFIATMNTNYFGAVRCIKAVLPGMRTAKKGCIINISSVAGRIASSPLGPYNASKFALEAMSESLAGEVKPHNIRVAIVEPGIQDTKMAHAIEDPPPSAYPHTRRFAGLFRAALERHVPPSMSDEQWVDWNAQEDEAWYDAVQQTFGLNARPQARAGGAGEY